MFARWRGWLLIPLYESICGGFWWFPEFPPESLKHVGIRPQNPPPRPSLYIGITSSASPLNEGLSLKIFIQHSWTNEGEDFIQCKVFWALPEGRRSQKLGHHRNLKICQIAIEGRDLPGPRPRRRRSQLLDDATPPPMFTRMTGRGWMDVARQRVKKHHLSMFPVVIIMKGSQCGPSPGQGAKLAEISAQSRAGRVKEYITVLARFQLGWCH